MERRFRILRFNPLYDVKPHYQDYRIKVQPFWSVLDCLNEIKWKLDGSLSFRRSCAHGVCGSDAMMINGRNRLACRTLIRDLKPSRVIRVEPLKSFPVIKDLFVDTDEFFQRNLAVKPWFVNQTPPPERERLQSPKQRARIDDSTKCILCASCTSSCPTFWFDKAYLGPAALLKAHRFVFDSRDEAQAERLAILNDRTGPYKCHTIFNCMEACPKEINVTGAIADLKKRILWSKIRRKGKKTEGG
ncbi:MAG: succinate dehydrogenase iron-sulfur subunit [Nitrospirae bacterium CG_4_10_14_3_um_filter_53_41]|nr:MAG: succinate dehydrogenase iron-sulfur subunit [Nitrospirae bacterium CG_4_10_14_3_um_filter_53_41]